jgi:hypothetical protein
MARVFTNYYTFALGAVPVAETLHDQISREFQTTLQLEQHEQGYHGAARAFANLTNERIHLWIYWEPQRPELEINVTEPMERMRPINAALIALGGKPRFPDEHWTAYRRQLTRATIRKVIVSALLLALAVFTIWHLHWWGLVLVIAAVAIAIGLFILGLARTFSHP